MWVLYVWVALVPLIGAIFGRIEDDIDKETFFGPNVLKMTLCISPLLLLLLLNTAVDSVDYQELVLKKVDRTVKLLYMSVHRKYKFQAC